MRIALVSEHASPLAVLGGVDAGGQNVHVAALAAQLVRRGHEVTVYTRRDSTELPESVQTPDGYRVRHVSAGPATAIAKDDLLRHMPRFGAELERLWRTEGTPDVAHAHFWMSGLATLPAARSLGAPLVQTFHALGTVKRRHQADKDSSPAERIAVEARLARQADLVVATCRDEVRELRRMHSGDTPVHVVPCGVDVDHFAPGPEHPVPGRLLAIGRLVERKGLDTVIAALAGLPDTELLIAGGPDAAAVGRDPEVLRLQAWAVDNRVDDRVRFLGRVERQELPALIRSAVAVVATPWYEPFGIVPLEAAACGRPVVASAVGGMLDSVLPGVTGLRVPPRDPEMLRGALASLLADPELGRRLGEAARDRAVKRYAWPHVGAATERAYAAALASDPAVMAG